MNSNDWVQMAGHPLAGRGGRPINPRALPYLATKMRSAKAPALSRQTRRMLLQVARLTGEVDDLLSPTASRQRARAATRSPSLMEQSWPGQVGAAARLRHTATVQRWRKGL